MLEKKAVLFARDEKGELVPQEVKLEVDEDDEYQAQYKDETITMIPIPRGKIKKLFSRLRKEIDEKKSEDEQFDMDDEIVLDHCIIPKFTKDELKHINQHHISMIVNTIMRESGLKVGVSKKKSLEKVEGDFSKNSAELNPKEKKEI